MGKKWLWWIVDTILEATNWFVQDHFVQDPFMHDIDKQTEDQRVALLLL